MRSNSRCQFWQALGCVCVCVCVCLLLLTPFCRLFNRCCWVPEKKAVPVQLCHCQSHRPNQCMCANPWRFTAFTVIRSSSTCAWDFGSLSVRSLAVMRCAAWFMSSPPIASHSSDYHLTTIAKLAMPITICTVYMWFIIWPLNSF